MKFAFGACFFVYVPLLPFIWAASRMFQMWESRRDIVEESERQRLRSAWLARKLDEIAGGPVRDYELTGDPIEDQAVTSSS